MSERGRKFRRSRLSSGESDISDLSSSFSSPFSSDDEVDAKDLKSIKEYVNNRKELVAQMFKSMTPKSIDRMLPNELKKIDYEQLRELCVNELIGMSGTRIKCIIDKKEMLVSSDTDSDDSGPSLEIVSDTELISDDDLIIKEEEPKNAADKKKKKSQSSKSKSKKNEKSSKNSKTNVKVKNEKVKNEKIKTEKKDKEKVKEKEGENLLDLLELEMRARAIRALIRKEETSSSVVPAPTNNSTVSTASSSKTANETASKVRQNQLKEQLEKIDVLMKHGDDEDLFIVVNPAPTIELISSDDENELISEKDKNSNNSNENANLEQNEKSITEKNDKETASMTESLNKSQDSQKEKETNKTSDSTEKMDTDVNLNLPISVTESMEVDESTVSVEKPVDLEDGEICEEEEKVQDKVDDSLKDSLNIETKTASKKVKKNNSEKRSNQDPESGKKIKKIKKNPHIRSQKLSKKSVNSADTSIKSSKSSKKTKHDEPIEIQDSPESLKEIKEEIFDDIELDKALDNIQEIINLDDYPDDEDDENMGNINSQTNDTTNDSKQKNEGEESMTSETWATRYYQKDEVQSVIKESKMQSEIRKRLRERQRQIKLKPKPLSQEPPKQSSIQPIGSVEEYLSLKGIQNTKSEKDEENLIEKDLPVNENKSLEEASTIETEKKDDTPEGPVTPEVEKRVVFTSKPMLSISSEKMVDSKNITVEKVSKILGDSVTNEIQTTSTQHCDMEDVNNEKTVKVYPRIIEDVYISNVNTKTDCIEEISNEVSNTENDQDLKQS